jgi:type I restriction enzyme S subunit
MKNNWNKLTIGNEINFLGGFPFSSSKFNEDGEGVPLIRIRDLLKSSQETYFSGTYSNTYLINEEDVLVGMDGDFHIVRWKNSHSLLNQRILKVSGKKSGKIDIDFLFYYLKPFLLDVHNKTAATTVKHLSTFDVSRAVDLFPPLPQQKKIAKILSTVDNVIEKTESAIAKYQAIKQGLMHDLFTRGIDVSTGKLRPTPQEAPELYKESVLGLIPRDWEVGNLEEIACLQGGFAFSSSFASEKGVRWLKIANVGFNKIKWNDKSYLPHNFIEQYSSFVLKENDLVMAMTRPIIRKDLKVSSITSNDLPSILNQRVGRFVISNIENTNFVKYLMQYREIISQIELEILGTDPPNVSSNQINSLKIKKPLEDEMYQIGLRIKKIDNKIQTEQQALGKYQQLKAGLLQDLLTGKVEVRID